MAAGESTVSPPLQLPCFSSTLSSLPFDFLTRPKGTGPYPPRLYPSLKLRSMTRCVFSRLTEPLFHLSSLQRYFVSPSCPVIEIPAACIAVSFDRSTPFPTKDAFSPFTFKKHQNAFLSSGKFCPMTSPLLDIALSSFPSWLGPSLYLFDRSCFFFFCFLFSPTRTHFLSKLPVPP